MNWIFILIAIVFYLSAYFFNKRTKKKFNELTENEHSKFINFARNNWKEFRIDSKDIVVINFDTKIDKNSDAYFLIKEDETFYDYINKNPNREELIDLSRTKILLQYKEDGKVVKKFSSIVDYDKTVVEFKIRLQDFVSVYLNNFSEDEYFVDLGFLKEEIDFSKFQK